MIRDRKWETLRARMEALGLREADIEEAFVRSSGRGGQHVNKTSSCVMLHHRPTGLRVKCMVSRRQSENRYFARDILCQKVDQRLHGERSEAGRRLHRIRAQKRKRSKRAKEKSLRLKRLRAGKKELRREPPLDE